MRSFLISATALLLLAACTQAQVDKFNTKVATDAATVKADVQKAIQVGCTFDGKFQPVVAQYAADGTLVLALAGQTALAGEVTLATTTDATAIHPAVQVFCAHNGGTAATAPAAPAAVPAQ